MLAASIAASVLLFLNVPAARSAPISLDCTGATGTATSSLATANTNGATASDSLTVSNAPVGTTITLSYTSTSNNNKQAQSSLASPAASGPLPSTARTINGTAGTGTQLWTKTTGADPVINVTLTKTAAAGGAATMNWSATCSAGRTLSITNTTNGAEAGSVNGVLTVTQTSVSATNTVVSLTYGGTATNTTDYSRPASVTIPAGSLSADVTLVVVDDAAVEVAETVIVTLGTVTSGSAAVVAPSSATNTITSDDVGAINVTTTDSSATEAPGDTGAFTVSLSALPSATVTVSIGTSTQCNRSPATLTFTTANWNVAQTVTITPVNDAIVEGPHTCAQASITAANGGYSGVTATPPTIDITDNDVGTITVAVTDANAAEAAGNTGAFTVRLGFQPSATVTVSIGTSAQCNFSTASLTFTTANWNTTQTVTATPINDVIVEGAHTCSPAFISAANGNYDGVTATPPTINITDNDVGTIVLATTDNTATEAPGDTGAFTVRLGLQPSADVTVAIAASAQCNFSVTSMTFTTANWNVTQSVTVTPIDDAAAEGAHTCSPAPLTASGGGYNSVTAALPTINITDNDFGTINLTLTDNAATETPGDTGAFTISLSAQPSATVTVSIGTSAQCARAPATLTFTTVNWNVAQTVTITPNDDAVIEGPHTCAPASITAANGGYSGVTATPPTINITDNDVASMTVVLTDDAATEAPGDTGAFTIVLNAQPSATVTVTIGTSPQCNRSPTSLTFTTANWNTARTVTITPINDAVVEGPHSCNQASITAANGGYDGVTATPPTINITDNDIGTIALVTTDSNASEAGNTGAFTVRLGLQPSASVTVAIGTSAQCNFSTASVTFTTANWNTVQTVTATPIDDAIAEGAHTCSPASIAAAGGSYDGVTATPPTINIADNDVAGITVAGGSLTVTEAGSTATFTIVLTSQPTGDVTVPLAASNLAEATVAPVSLTFTATTWSIAQTVTVTGVDDAIDDGNVVSSVTIGATASSDANYNGLTPAAVGVTTTDDDTAGITVTGGPLTVTEAGSTATFNIVLTSQPTGDVTVPLTASNLAEATVAPLSLTFSANTWSVAQTVTVTGVDDAIDDGDVVSSVAIGVTASSDANYNGLTPAAVGVTTTDDDTAGVTVTGGPLTVTEAGSTATFTIVLTSQPTSDVTVPLAASNLAEATVAPVSLTFTATTWSIAQTVTVTGVDDTIDDGDIVSPVSIGATTSSDANYNGLSPAAVGVTTTDDDTAGITVVGGPLTVTEAGSTASFTVVLTSQPTDDVTVPLAVSDVSEATASPTSLTFTATAWNVAQTVTVTGVDDAVDDGDTGSSITIGATTSSDANYNGLTPAAVDVTTTDDDTSGITIAGGPLTVTEAGSSATFTIVLSSQPTGDVTVPLAVSDATEATVAPVSLTFTATTWSVAQTVTVTGVDDAIDDGDIVSSVSIGATISGDANYNGLSPSAVNVTTTDGDTSGITVTGGPLTVTEAGSTASFTVVLTSQPASDVTVPLATSDISEATASPTSLTFTATTWSVAQTVTVSGVDDAVDDGDMVSSVTIGATVSSDANYNELTPAAVGVTTTDDDTAGIAVTGGPLTVTEAGSSATFTIVLTSQPTGDVTVPLACSNLAEASVSPPSLMFTTASWSVAQTVTVTGVDDAAEDGDTNSSITIGATASPDANFNGLTPAAVGVTTTDDDEAINALVRDAFEQQTHDFMARRQSLILTHEPTFQRLVNRGRAGWSKGENSLDIQGYASELRGSFSLNARSAVEVLSDPLGVESEPSYDPSKALNAWAEGQFGIYSEDEGGSKDSGDFFLGYAGIDWRLNERLMVGVMGEFDWVHETSAAVGGDMEGTGWMVGPYVSYALSEKLFLDARAMWGRSENSAAQDVLGDRYQGDFDTERWLVDARLAGLHRIGSLTIEPELGLTYMNEDQLDYAVAGQDRNIWVDGQFVSTGILSAGGEISQSIPYGDLTIEPFVSGRALWSFDDPLQPSGISATGSLGAQFGLGLGISSARTRFSSELTYGTIGIDGLNVFSAKLSFDHAF